MSHLFNSFRMRRQFPLFSLLLLILVSCGTSKSLHHKPVLEGYNGAIPIVKKLPNNVFSTGNDFFLKNKQNLWELYVEGDPLERGLAMGGLTDSLLTAPLRSACRAPESRSPHRLRRAGRRGPRSRP